MIVHALAHNYVNVHVSKTMHLQMHDLRKRLKKIELLNVFYFLLNRLCLKTSKSISYCIRRKKRVHTI